MNTYIERVTRGLAYLLNPFQTTGSNDVNNSTDMETVVLGLKKSVNTVKL